MGLKGQLGAGALLAASAPLAAGGLLDLRAEAPLGAAAPLGAEDLPGAEAPLRCCGPSGRLSSAWLSSPIWFVVRGHPWEKSSLKGGGGGSTSSVVLQGRSRAKRGPFPPRDSLRCCPAAPFKGGLPDGAPCPLSSAVTKRGKPRVIASSGQLLVPGVCLQGASPGCQ